MSVTRQMTIDDIFANHPQRAQQLAQAMTAAGLQCVGCGAATFETLEAGMYGHGMSDEQIDAMVATLNGILAEASTPQDTITLTERAAVKYRALLHSEGKEGWGVRFEEKPGGCNGFEYVLDYSEKARPNDTTFVSHGVEIHVDRALLDRLLGSQIDYLDGLRGSGFKISNPNVRSACGCGQSHGY